MNRRGFLGFLGFSGAAAALPSLPALPAPEEQITDANIGQVIGGVIRTRSNDFVIDLNNGVIYL